MWIKYWFNSYLSNADTEIQLQHYVVVFGQAQKIGLNQ